MFNVFLFKVKPFLLFFFSKFSSFYPRGVPDQEYGQQYEQYTNDDEVTNDDEYTK